MTHMTKSTPPKDSWAHWLEAGETLIWTGQPAHGFRVKMGTALACFPFFFPGLFVSTLLVSGSSMPGGLNTTGAVTFVFLNLILVTSFILLVSAVETKRRNTSFFSLTSKRAVVGHTWPFKTLKTYRFKDIVERAYGHKLIFDTAVTPPSVYFWSRTRVTNWGTRTCYKGFENIRDAETVMFHLHAIGLTCDTDRRAA